MITLTDDMRAVIQSAHLCFAATVTQGGMPNLSPKGTIRVWDEHHLFFLDIASPATRENLRHNPYMEINVVEHLSRRGYRFFGRAELHHSDPVYEEARRKVFEEEKTEYPVKHVVLLQVERADALISPGYLHIHSEAEMRRAWRERRAALDKEFDHHASKSPFRPIGIADHHP